MSHSLTTATPGFGGRNEFSVQVRKSIANGDSSNSIDIQMSNHIGTHVDLPKHFDSNGKSLSDYPINSWMFSRPQIVDYPANNDELIDFSTFSKSILTDCDILLVRTGFEKKRNTNEYWQHNPGVKAESGFFLRKHCPQLRAIGFDFISLTAFQHRDEGRLAHRAFLSDFEGKDPIWIVEDMKLSAWAETVKRILLSPLLVQGADGAPVSVWGLID